MAVDTQKLFYLLDPVFQIENLAGKPVVGGHIEVFVAGTDTKYITWQDWGGARNPFKIPLKSDGRAVILVEPQYTYDVYVYDSFNNMVCSRLNVSPAIGGDVSVSGLTQVYHDETISGNGTPYEPLGIVSGGKTYEGIEPIVVNNEVNKISANNVALGLQEPLFFVEDSETACIIGCSAQTEIPSALSGKWDEASDVVIANSAQWSEGREYEAGSYIDIDGNTINVTGVQPAGNYQSAGDYVVHDELSAYATEDWVEQQSYMHEYMESAFYPMTGNPSGFLTAHQDISNKLDTTAFSTVSGDFLTAVPSEYVTENTLQSGLSSKLDSTAFSTVSGDFLTAIPAGYATENWVTSQGYLTSVDIPESATWNATTETVSANSAQWGARNPQIPVTSTSGISIFESGDKVYFNISADYATEDWVTGQGYLTASYTPEFAYHDTAISSIDNSALYDTSAHARINTLAGRISDLSSNKLDTTAFSDVSGTFITAHQDLSDYQTTAGMTAYQSAGDYMTTADSANFYTTANESGFITGVDLTPYQTVEGMTAYQEAGDYYSASNPSGFLTAHQSLAGYLQDSDLGISDNKITAISGVELSAGGDVPEGVMVESGIEYNSQGYINGYSGSAIATIDETVLWTSGVGTSAVTLSESIENFESIKLVHNTQVEEFRNPKAGDTVRYWHGYGTMTQNTYKMAMVHLSFTDATHITNVSAKSLFFPTTGTTTAFTVNLNDTYSLNTIRAVIGCNRISGGN